MNMANINTMPNEIIFKIAMDIHVNMGDSNDAPHMIRFAHSCKKILKILSARSRELVAHYIYQSEYEYHITYNYNGVRHNIDDKPAIISHKNEELHWFHYGKLHRKNGPAILYEDGCAFWYQHGKLHRDDGPAIDDELFARREYYINGRRIYYLGQLPLNNIRTMANDHPLYYEIIRILLDNFDCIRTTFQLVSADKKLYQEFKQIMTGFNILDITYYTCYNIADYNVDIRLYLRVEYKLPSNTYYDLEKFYVHTIHNGTLQAMMCKCKSICETISLTNNTARIIIGKLINGKYKRDKTRHIYIQIFA
jgi:hypothetical protein